MRVEYVDITAEQFVRDLEKSIEMSANRPYVPTATYKPSSLNCIRNMFYQMRQVPTASTTSAMLDGICSVGSSIHNWIQDKVKEMQKNGFDCEYIDVEEYVQRANLPLEIRGKQGNETKLYNPQLNMIFLCDGIIRYKSKYMIIEFKTEGKEAWKARTGIADDHRNQALAYCHNLLLYNVLFIYICRDNTKMKPYMFSCTSFDTMSISKIIHDCDGYLQENVLPPAEKTSVKACDFCPYKSYCSEDYLPAALDTLQGS